MMDLTGQIVCGDARCILPQIEGNTIDLVLTDPPYFLDKLNGSWDPKKVESKRYQYVVKSLPAGMKFDREQGRRLYEWFLEISRELYRVLKPGGWLFSFSSPRLYHRMASAADDAGFLIRDCFLWIYTQSQPKAMGLAHFIRRLPYDEETKADLEKRLAGWKTPQVKSCFEPILVAQKQYDGTFLKNMLKYNVGLFNTAVRLGRNKFPANILLVEGMDEILDRYFLIPKPKKQAYNIHKTVKPLAICEYLIELSTLPGAIVLDPFVGSGTTAVAAKKRGRRFIGIDINREYVEIARRRLCEVNKGQLTLWEVHGE